MRRDAGYEAWLYFAMFLYTVLNNTIELTIMRTQEFAWLAFLILYMCCAARARGIVLGTRRVEAPPATVLSRARPAAARREA